MALSELSVGQNFMTRPTNSIKNSDLARPELQYGTETLAKLPLQPAGRLTINGRDMSRKWFCGICLSNNALSD